LLFAIHTLSGHGPSFLTAPETPSQIDGHTSKE